LSKLEDVEMHLSLLVREGVTRRERTSSDDPIVEIDGPVLDESCDMLCVECETSL
ncbi:hypothetical protein C8J57DRAFT_1010229, partial [Mycena rebaudengoi]